MQFKWTSILAGAALATGLSTAMAQAPANTVRFALCYDLSKSYTFVTPQIAQAAKDYAEILNAKGHVFKHPDDEPDAELTCADCHNGGIQE